MAIESTVQIPVVRNRIVLREPRPRTRLYLFTATAVLLIVMLFYIWLQVQINVRLREISRLEQQNRVVQEEIQKLEAEVVELSSYGRIHQIAEKLGLEPVPNEKIVRLGE